MEIAAAVVAVGDTVLGAGVVGVQQYYAARAQRRQTLRDRALTALSELSTALADHRRAMWLRKDLRLSGAAPADAVTAPQVALTVLLPQLRRDVNAAVRAAYDMHGAASTQVLAARRESAISAADSLAASVAYLLSRPHHKRPHPRSCSSGGALRAVRHPTRKGEPRPMNAIAAVQAIVTADEYDRGPTAAELDAIETELPLIRAEVELLDVQIALMDKAPSELDARRLRRARRRVLAARRELTNRATATAGEAA